MASRLAAWLGLSLALSLSVPARADEPPSPPQIAAKPSGGAAPNKPFMSRPIVVGLLAALFLIVAGAAGANDKKKPA